MKASLGLCLMVAASAACMNTLTVTWTGCGARTVTYAAK